MDAIFQLMAFFLMILPLIIVAFTLRWLRLLYKNSERMTKQNEEIIELLKKEN